MHVAGLASGRGDPLVSALNFEATRHPRRARPVVMGWLGVMSHVWNPQCGVFRRSLGKICTVSPVGSHQNVQTCYRQHPGVFWTWGPTRPPRQARCLGRGVMTTGGWVGFLAQKPRPFTSAQAGILSQSGLGTRLSGGSDVSFRRRWVVGVRFHARQAARVPIPNARKGLSHGPVP